MMPNYRTEPTATTPVVELNAASAAAHAWRWPIKIGASSHQPHVMIGKSSISAIRTALRLVAVLLWVAWMVFTFRHIREADVLSVFAPAFRFPPTAFMGLCLLGISYVTATFYLEVVAVFAQSSRQWSTTQYMVRHFVLWAIISALQAAPWIMRATPK